MKKILALGLATVMAAGLTACGSSKPAQAPADTTKAETAQSAATEAPAASTEAAAPAEGADLNTSITLWTYPVGKWGDSATVDTLISDFNAKYPNVKVTVEYLDYTNGDDQVNTAIEGGQAPDMVLEGPERLVANWGAKGYMVDLSDIMSEDAASDLYESVKNACTGKDAEDFLKAVQAVYDSGQKDVLAVYCAGQGGDQGTRALINNMYSGTFTNAEHTEYTADSDQNVKALTALKNQKGVNFDASLVGGDEINLFRQGVLAMSLCWNAAQQTNTDAGNEMGKTNNGDEILPLLFPSDDGKTELCGGIWGFGVFDNGDQDKIAASKAFIDFFANSDETAKAVKASGFFPVHQNLTGVYDGEATADVMALFTKNFMPSMGDYYQVVPGWAEARTAWWNMLQRIGSGGDVKTELAAFDKEANAAAAAGK